MNFNKIIDIPLSERLARLIRQAIFTGQLPAGSKIPQDDLAEKFGVSRMPIREALVILNHEGLVILEPRRGAWVASLSLQTVDESYTMRRWTESQAVSLSVPLLNSEDLEKARIAITHLEAAESAQDPDAFVEANAEFHAILRSRCPWPKLSSWADTLWNGFPPLTPAFVANQMVHDRAEHRILWEAASERNGPRAARVMKEHIHRSWQSAREHFHKLGWPDTPVEVPGDTHATR